MPCGGCIRRLCPNLCQGIEKDNVARHTPRARSSEAPLGRSQAFTAGAQPLVGSEDEQMDVNDYISFPSIPISSPLFVSQDHESGAQLEWGDVPEDYSRMSASNTAQSNHLLPDVRPGGSNKSQGTRQTQGVESDPSTNVGSLRLDTGGRSRYFGPTAASQWLRDVSQVYCT